VASSTEGEKTISVRVPFSMYLALREAARSRNTSVSELVREVLKRFLEEESRGR